VTASSDVRERHRIRVVDIVGSSAGAAADFSRLANVSGRMAGGCAPSVVTAARWTAPTSADGPNHSRQPAAQADGARRWTTPGVHNFAPWPASDALPLAR
jgi:hypothetical protein